jgi:uncharacterized delta-60 repeat protein
MISVFKTFRSKMFSAVVLIALTAFLQISSFGAGEVDTSFNAYLAKVGQGTVYRSALQPDGKIIVSGYFNMVNGVLKQTIVRLNADGSLDTTFNSPVINGLEQINIHALGLQSNGKIVIGGPFYQINGVTRYGIARLNSDGSPDTAFNSNPALTYIAQVHDLKISPDDKIVLGGIKSGSVYTVMRLNADGSFDAEYTPSQLPFRLDIQPDGKVVFYENFIGVRRLNQDLTLDNTFTLVTTDRTVYLVKALPDGKTLISGIFTQTNGTSSPGLVRVNANGSVDVSFVANMSGVGSVSAVIALPDGKIIVPSNGGNLVLRNADGTLNSSFSASTSLTGISDLDLQPDGKIVVSGTGNGESVSPSLVLRLNSDGSPDTSFQSAIGRFAYGSRVKTLPDSKFYVAGSFNYSGGVARHDLIRFNADGTVDTTFNQNVFFNSGPVFDVFPDGKIIAMGSPVGTARLKSDGTLDILYPGAGGRDVVALPDGKALFAKNGSLERYNADGTFDATFNVPVGGDIFDIALQPDGKILIGGNFLNVHGIDRSKIARLNADGTLDSSFNSPTGGINGVVLNIVLSPGGKFVINGTFSGISFNTREGLARLNPNGSLDTDFVPPRTYSVDDIKVQPDGKVLTSGPNVPVIRRLNANGSLDTTFNVTATVDNNDIPRVRGFDLQTGGKIVITGDFLRINGVLAPGIARLLNTISGTKFDYDGDGKADVSVFRPSTNRWYEFLSSFGTVAEQTFGINGDLIAPADYDGDGKTDIGIYRASSGDWWYLSSLDGGQKSVHWGAPGDIPRPSDFDGDGKADYIVFRPSNNVWYRFGSTGATSITAFGLAGDKPVTGDFDGDGKSDLAIFRPSDGNWWYLSSLDGGQRAVQWGISTDIPAPADFDGDGKTDFAVYRPSTGTWYIINSGNGSFTIMNFGISEDKPVPADYDGDGKADIAVFRPSTGTWYQQKTTAGFAAQQFGTGTDIPTENAFVP